MKNSLSQGMRTLLTVLLLPRLVRRGFAFSQARALIIIRVSLVANAAAHRALLNTRTLPSDFDYYMMDDDSVLKKVL